MKTDYPVRLLCRVLGIGHSTYYASAARSHGPTPAELDEAYRADSARDAWAEHRGVYGARRLTAEVRSRGHAWNRKHVAHLMRLTSIEGAHRRRRGKYGKRTASTATAPDLVERHFAAEAPDRLWVADITYLRTWEGFLYLAVVVDAFSRRIVGWAVADHLCTELILDAVGMAIQRRRPQPGTIHHSDRGTQGGLNWSTQHLDQEVDLGAWTRVDGDLDGAPVDAITGTAPGAPRHRTRLLAQDRRRTEQRRRRSRGGRVRARRLTVVPPRWRHGDDHPDRGVRALPLLRRT